MHLYNQTPKKCRANSIGAKNIWSVHNTLDDYTQLWVFSSVWRITEQCYVTMSQQLNMIWSLLKLRKYDFFGIFNWHWTLYEALITYHQRWLTSPKRQLRSHAHLPLPCSLIGRAFGLSLPLALYERRQRPWWRRLIVSAHQKRDESQTSPARRRKRHHKLQQQQLRHTVRLSPGEKTLFVGIRFLPG